MNASAPSSAELLRGRYFTAFAAPLPCGALVLLPADTAARIDRCPAHQLVPGIRVETEDRPDWETVIAEWMLGCDGQVELTSASDIRLALRDCADAENGLGFAGNWDCGPWPEPSRSGW